MLILDFLKDTFTSFTIWLCTGVYNIASYIFKIFLILSNGQLIEAEHYNSLLNNVYIILSVVLLFFISFQLLKTLANQEAEKNSATTIRKIIINVVTSAMMLIFLPYIFSFAFDFQKSFLRDYNVIGKFFGYENNMRAGGYDAVQYGAYRITNSIFNAFYHVSDCNSNDIFECQKIESDFVVTIPGQGSTVITLNRAIDIVNETGNFYVYTAFHDKIKNGEIYFSFILCLLAGLYLIYISFSYAIDMGLRLVKLVFYQIIAPFPIFARIIPDTKISDMFKKWTNVTLTCYFEVYLRIIILYFCVYLCQAMIDSNFLKEVGNTYEWYTLVIVKAFVLMGIVTFMKQAPKLIADVTGIDSGNMKLGIKEKLKEGGFFTAAAVTGGLATGLVRNAIKTYGNKENWVNKKTGKANFGTVTKNLFRGIGSSVGGGLSSAFRSGKSAYGKAGSFKEMHAAYKEGTAASEDARDKRWKYRASHGDTLAGTIGGRIMDFGIGISKWAGFNNPEEIKREVAQMDEVKNATDTLKGGIKSMILEATSKGKKFNFGSKKYSTEELRKLEQEMNQKLSDPTISASDRIEAQDKYNKYLKNFVDELSEISMLNNEEHEKYLEDLGTQEERVLMNQSRKDAERLKGTLKRASASEFVTLANKRTIENYELYRVMRSYMRDLVDEQGNVILELNKFMRNGVLQIGDLREAIGNLSEKNLKSVYSALNHDSSGKQILRLIRNSKDYERVRDQDTITVKNIDEGLRMSDHTAFKLSGQVIDELKSEAEVVLTQMDQAEKNKEGDK